MSTTSKVLMFGSISGLVWSGVPGALSELFRSPGETITVILSGILTGLLVSFALSVVLVKYGRWATFGYGILSLPFGAFAFGVIISLVQWLVRESSGIAYRFAADRFSPFETGFDYAVFSVISIFATILFPLAILTTFPLRAVLISGRRNERVV